MREEPSKTSATRLEWRVKASSSLLVAGVLQGGCGQSQLSPDRMSQGIESFEYWSEMLGMEFVRIPEGEFRMGSTSAEAFGDERPVRRVQISRAFELGKYEATQA